MLKRGYGILKDAVNDFIDDDCMSLGAALAFYTTFSLAPVLFIATTLAGLIFGPEAVQGRLEAEIRNLVGTDSARQIQEMLTNVVENTTGGMLATIIGTVTLLFASTTAFAQLQTALNRIWKVKPDPEAGGIRNFLTKRLLSFSLILVIGFLLLVSLALSAVITALGDRLTLFLPGDLSGWLLESIHIGVSLFLITLLFAAMFKFLPDAKIDWQHVWGGALFTALLFGAGKFGIGFYLGASDMATTYGAAGSFILILMWVYYSSFILFLGAEVTQVTMRRHGERIKPEEGAVKAIEKEHVIRSETDHAA
jgi:membrane protein